MINTDFTIEVTKNSGCFNTPHRFFLTLSQSPEVLKAIKLKHSINVWKYLSNEWTIYVNDKNIILEKGMKKIEGLDEYLKEAKIYLEEILTFSDFEINVAKELLEKETV